jgi:hypothetical protein
VKVPVLGNGEPSQVPFVTETVAALAYTSEPVIAGSEEIVGVADTTSVVAEDREIEPCPFEAV